MIRYDFLFISTHSHQQISWKESIILWSAISTDLTLFNVFMQLLKQKVYEIIFTASSDMRTSIRDILEHKKKILNF